MATICTVCRDGSAVPFPDNILRVEGFPVDRCGDLELLTPFFLQGSELCDDVQSIGSLCGCEIPDNACRLCSDGSSVTNPSLFLPTYLASDFFIGAPEGSVLSCATLEAVLHRYEEDAALCLSVQADVADDCGCPGVSIPSQLPTGSPDVSVPSQFPTGSPVTQFPTRPNTEGTGRKGKKEKRLTNGGRGRKVKKDKAIRKKGNFV